MTTSVCFVMLAYYADGSGIPQLRISWDAEAIIGHILGMAEAARTIEVYAIDMYTQAGASRRSINENDL